jgi:hypothetical protein
MVRWWMDAGSLWPSGLYNMVTWAHRFQKNPFVRLVGAFFSHQVVKIFHQIKYTARIESEA